MPLLLPMALLVLVAWVGPVASAHASWPQAGATSSRSGVAPTPQGALPLSAVWAAGDGATTAGPVAGAGTVAFAAGTRVLLRRLADGAQVADEDAGAPVGGLAIASGTVFAFAGDPATGLRVLRLDAAGGARGGDLVLPGSAGHAASTPPLLDGGVLWVLGDRVDGATLWRVPLTGDEAPTATDLPDADGTVAPARFDAGIVVAGADELIVAPSGERIALGCAPRALAFGVVLCSDGVVRRVVGSAIAQSSGPLSGSPAGLAVSAHPPGVTDTAPAPPDRAPAEAVVATTSTGLAVLDRDLALRGTVAGDFGAVAPAIARDRVHAGHAVVSLTDLAVTGAVGPEDRGQPALTQGYVLVATATGLTAERDQDATPPAVEIASPAGGRVSGTIALAAAASDDRGMASVSFRLAAPGHPAVEIARDADGAGGWTGAYFTPQVPNGTYLLDAVATDAAGLRTTSAPVTIEIANTTSQPELRLLAGACANVRVGTDEGERLIGTDAGDRLLPGAGDDALEGRAGDDCLEGAAGDDVLDGDAGADRLAGGPEDDDLSGGGGDDVLDGGAESDLLRGDRGRDRLLGGGGADALRGGADVDTLIGGAGADRLEGGSGTDTLRGGSGDDLLHPGSGTNGVDAGPGDDRIFARNDRRDAITCGSGRDRVIADRRDRVASTCESVRRG